jgi:L-alanine-DL-glutamate epimerase-like enolase superfamily enzyme
MNKPLLLECFRFDLPLAAPFRIAHETRMAQPTVIACLSDGEYRGLGEATATRYYGLVAEEMIANLERLRSLIESTPLHSPEAYWENLRPHIGDRPFEQCALDVAAHDLHARRMGLPLYQLWKLDPHRAPLTSFTIGIGPIEEMQEKIRARPWPIYKIKLGADEDLEIVRALRRETRAIFRVDANTAWTAEQTIAYAPELKKLGVEFIEQPLPAGDWEGMREVYLHCALPVIADESCQGEADVDKCQGFFHGVNIKLMKCGGLTPARRMIDRARTLGLSVMVGCMTESSVGISAIAHLSPLLDYVDMDGALLLKEDIALGVCIDEGKVYFPNASGTGASLL